MLLSLSILRRARTFGTLSGLLCVAAPGMAGDIPGGDRFGESVDLSGDTVIVGRPSTRPGTGSGEGAALVYVRRDGVLRFEAELASDRGTGSDGFGSVVALSGNTAAVAAPAASPPRVYLFVRQGTRWLPSARIDASQANSGFARTLDLDVDTLVVGARFRNGSRGGVHVYQRAGKTWPLLATLAADDGAPDDYFGSAVAVDAARILVGAFGRDLGGAAYVFERTGAVWQQTARLVAANPRIGDRFGLAVALDGDRAVVGAPGTQADDFEEQGAAIVFERQTGNWVETAELSAFDGRQNDLFGWSLSLDGDTLVAGAIFDTDSVALQGSAYAFTHLGGVWLSSVKLRAPSPRDSDIFGNSVALGGNLLWIGAPGFQNNGFGTAYAFERTGLLWNVGERFVDPTLFADQFESN
ncbi:MAG: hypothetical protein ABIP49_08160 [Lysobacterales bacterium]